MEDGRNRGFEDSAKPQTNGEYVYSKGNPDVERVKSVDGVVLAEEAPLSVGVGQGEARSVAGPPRNPAIGDPKVAQIATATHESDLLSERLTKNSIVLYKRM